MSAVWDKAQHIVQCSECSPQSYWFPIAYPHNFVWWCLMTFTQLRRALSMWHFSITFRFSLMLKQIHFILFWLFYHWMWVSCNLIHFLLNILQWYSHSSTRENFMFYPSFLCFTGPSVLEVFNNLLRHLRISVDNRSSNQALHTAEVRFQDAIVNTIGKCCLINPSELDLPWN